MAHEMFENWRSFLEELVDPDSIDLSSFAVKDKLNPQIWNNDRLRPEVKDRLITIAQEFFDGLDLPDVQLKDITFTGSLANFTWSQFSDVDLHLIIDFEEVDANPEVVKKWLDQARAMWNKNHDIDIGGHEVEIYVQNDTEPHVSTGVYSIFNDNWLTKPEREKPLVKWTEVQEKAASLMDEIDEIEKMLTNGETDDALSYAERLKEKIRKFRQGGLERGGEFSIENITFKTLRRNKYLEKLSNIKTDAFDQSMSLQESRRWREVTNESAITPAQVPQGWHFLIDERGSGKVTIHLRDNNDVAVGKIILMEDGRLPCLKALSVTTAYAPNGFGPMLYDLAMELSGEKGIYSDRTGASEAAQRVWEFYEHHRSDVESYHPLEVIDEREAETECVEDITLLFGEEWEDDPLSKIFKKRSKKLETLEALKAAKKVSFI